MNRTCLFPIALLSVLVAETVTEAPPRTLLDVGIQQFRDGYRTWDAELLDQAATTFQRAAAEQPRDYAAAYWLGVARFHIVLHRRNTTSTQGKTTECATLIHEAQTALKRAIELNRRDAEANAMLGVLVGMEISDHPVRSLWQGPYVQQCLRKALHNGADNPRVQYLRGACLLEGPDTLGGPSKAIECLRAAERLFAHEVPEKKRAGLDAFSWGHDHCLVFIGRAYARLGDASAAREYFNKALAMAPDNRLAQRSLNALQEATAQHD